MVGCSNISWHTWGERNKHYKEQVSRPAEVVAKEFIHDLDIIFGKEKYKKAQRSKLAGIAIERWLEA